MKKSGFTLIEVLIYTALIGVAGVFLNSTLISVLKLQNQQDASTEVNQQINFVLQNIQKSVRESSLIEMAGNVASSTLTLRMTDAALDPTLIYLSGTTVYIKKGAAAALALTTSSVNADQLDFTKVSSYPGHDSVSVDISFSYNTDNPQQAFTKTINSAISRVSGATFDSDILPGADATYSVGSVANRWQNLNLSGDLTVAGASSFTGNVGIGTAIPGVNLHVVGPTTVTNSAIRIESGDDSSAIWKSALDIRHTTGTTISSGSSVGISFDPLASTGSGYFGSAAIKAVRENATANNQDTALSFWTRTGASNSTTDTEKMRITSTGKVGIGTTGPNTLTHIYTGASTVGNPISGTNLNIESNSSNYLSLLGPEAAIQGLVIGIPGQNTDTWIRRRGDQTNNPLEFGAGATARMAILDNGNVGIGTTSPSQLLSVAGTIYSSAGYRFPDGTTQTTAGGGSTVHVPTRQIFTTGSGTYTTPADVGYIKVRMVGGGGGGGGTHSGATAGGTGGTTSFNSVTAVGGGGGSAGGTGGDGGTGGTGTASLRIPGGGGDDNSGSAASGGSSPFGGAGRGKIFGSGSGTPAATNSGSGGGGNQCNGCSPAYSSGGGAGEYAELIITNPSATYSYAVGAAGTGGAGTYPGGAGGSGVIIVDEYYATAMSTQSNVVRQVVSSMVTTPFAAQGTAIPTDNTIPQITEGYEVLTITMTPTASDSRIMIEAVVNYDEPSNVGNGGVIALFKDSGPDAIAVTGASVNGAETSPRTATMKFMTTAGGNTSSRTYSIRIGCSTANCIEVNREGYIAGLGYGGTMVSSLIVTELSP